MHCQVVEITLDVALASIGFLPIITLQCMIRRSLIMVLSQSIGGPMGPIQ